MARAVLTAGAMLRWILPAVLCCFSCGREDERPAAPSHEVASPTSEASTDAVLAAVEARFERSVKAPFLEGQGMTVRGLVRAASLARPSKVREALDPARYDAQRTSAKLELVGGKVIYTASASGEDAAEVRVGARRFSVAYEVSAEVSPDGELRAASIHQLGAARQLD